MIEQSRKIGVFGHGFTCSGHPVASAVALKALEIYARDGIVDRAKRKSPHFLARLRKLGQHPLVGDARGLGLLGAVELVVDKARKRSFDPRARIGACTVAFAEEEGVILRVLSGDTIAFCPPMVISFSKINELFDRFSRALDRSLDFCRAGTATHRMKSV
jgi:4-aminobutyrate---pyruvate transaminase